MKNFMQNYKNEMDCLPVRESFEEDTLAFLQNSSMCSARQKKLQFQQFGRIAAAIALVCMLGTVTVAGATELNLPTLVRNLFADNTSADKIVNHEYQPLNAAVSNKDITITCAGMVGDKNTHYLLLKADVPKKLTENFESVAFDIRSYTSTDEKRNSCRYSYYTAEQLTTTGETYEYMIRYELPYAVAAYSYNNDAPIFIDVAEIRLNNGSYWETHTLSNLMFPLSLNDEFLADATKLTPQISFTTETRDTTLTKLYLSDYKTIVDFSFPAENFNDALAFWRALTGESLAKNNALATPVALYHNGSQVGRLEEYANWCPGRADKLDTSDRLLGAGTYCCSLILEAIDYQEGDTLELRCDDAVFPIK